MTFRDTENSFDLPPERDPGKLSICKVFRGITSCRREEFCIMYFCRLCVGVMYGLMQGRSQV